VTDEAKTAAWAAYVEARGMAQGETRDKAGLVFSAGFDAGIASASFIVDLDTAIANDQGETETGTIVDAYVLVLAYAKPGELPNYRLTLAAGMPYDRAIGLLAIGDRLLDETSFTIGDPG
jgi:hypothetical protein